MFVLEQESLGEGAGLGKGRGPQMRESPPSLRSATTTSLRWCTSSSSSRGGGLRLQQLHTLEEQEVCVKKQEVVNIAAMVTNSLSQFPKLLCEIILASLVDPDQPCGGLGQQADSPMKEPTKIKAPLA